MKNLYFKNSNIRNDDANLNKELLQDLDKIIKMCQEKLHHAPLKEKLENIIVQSTLLIQIFSEGHQSEQEKSLILQECQKLHTLSLQLPSQLVSEEQNYFYSISHRIAVITLYLALFVIFMAITFPFMDMYFNMIYFNMLTLPLTQALADSLMGSFPAIVSFLGISATSYAAYTLGHPTAIDLNPLQEAISAFCDKITNTTEQDLTPITP